jgi:hypothetical protein
VWPALRSPARPALRPPPPPAAARLPQEALSAALRALSSVVAHNTFTKNGARQLDVLPSLALLLRRPGALAGPAAVDIISTAADLCDSNHANQEALAEAGLVELLVGLLGAALADGLQGAAQRVELIRQLARAIGNAGAPPAAG